MSCTSNNQDSDIAALLCELKDRDSEIRLRAAQSLGQIKSNSVRGPLIEALQDPDIQVRLAVAQCLVDFTPEAALTVLTEALTNPQKRVREEAVSILSGFASSGIELDAAVDHLIKAIHDPVPLVSWTAV